MSCFVVIISIKSLLLSFIASKIRSIHCIYIDTTIVLAAIILTLYRQVFSQICGTIYAQCYCFFFKFYDNLFTGQ